MRSQFVTSLQQTQNLFVFFVKFLVGLCVKKLLEWQSFNTTKEYKHKDSK